jgi:hypothetical protein
MDLSLNYTTSFIQLKDDLIEEEFDIELDDSVIGNLLNFDLIKIYIEEAL